VVKVYRNTPQAVVRPATHQPMLWAALAFGAGILLGSYFWRPAIWWILAIAFFTVAAFHFLERRRPLAYALGLGALVFAGALGIQMRAPEESGAESIAQFADGAEVLVTGHAIREGKIQSTSGGELRQVARFRNGRG
jgi:hypothetical protein